jgi:caffeoyl-CoA O-methyltransferase
MGSNIKLNDQIEEYINSHSIKLHPVQYEIIKYNETLGEIKKMQISISQCHFLHFIIKIIKPKNILEIGTFTGLSALTMGLALDENSKLTSLDKNKETSDVAMSFFKKAKINNKINLLINSAIVSLENLYNQKKKFDFIFIDADKENYINYFNKSLNILNDNGIIVVDNVLWYGDVANQNKNDRLTLKIREFNKFINDDNRVENLILPIGDGLSVCRKI